MSVQSDIEAFLAELRAEGAITEPAEPLMRWLYSSDHPAAIKFCDAICAVIRRKELTLRERAAELRPILMKLLNSFGDQHC